MDFCCQSWRSSDTFKLFDMKMLFHFTYYLVIFILYTMNATMVMKFSLFLRSQGWQVCLSIEYEATASLAPILIV